MTITIIGLNQLEGVSRLLDNISKRSPTAARIALNKGATHARTMGSRLIREHKNLKAAYINKHLTVAQQATNARLSTTIAATRRGTLLSRYGMKQEWGRERMKSPRAKGKLGKRKRLGVSVQVNVGGPREHIRSAFIIKNLKNSGVPGIAIRTGKGRNAYRVLHSTSVHHAWQDVIPDVINPTREVINNELLRQLRRTGQA